jgi:hypothetical protein
VIDEFIDGNTGFVPIFAKTHWHSLLGYLDTLRFIVIADHVVGADAALAVGVWETSDVTLFEHLNLIALPIDFESILPNQVNTFQGSMVPGDANMPPSCAYMLGCALSGTDPKAHVRVWITGRGRV